MYVCTYMHAQDLFTMSGYKIMHTRTHEFRGFTSCQSPSRNLETTPAKVHMIFGQDMREGPLNEQLKLPDIKSQEMQKLKKKTCVELL